MCLLLGATLPMTPWVSVWASLRSHQQQNCQVIRDAYLLLDATNLPFTKVSSLYSYHQSQSSQPPHPPSKSTASYYFPDLLVTMIFTFWWLVRMCIISCLLVFEDMSHVDCLYLLSIIPLIVCLFLETERVLYIYCILILGLLYACKQYISWLQTCVHSSTLSSMLVSNFNVAQWIKVLFYVFAFCLLRNPWQF